LTVYPFPSITLRKASTSLRRLQVAFGTYFTAGHDHPSRGTSPFIYLRADAQRKHGMTGRQIGSTDFTAAIVSVTNTAPACYWLISYIFSRLDLVERLREESRKLVEHHRGEAHCTVSVQRVESDCPLLTSCYKEILRLKTGMVISRSVADDTTVSDGQGRQYLLKRGSLVQIPMATILRNMDIWGENVEEFDPERFLPRGPMNNGPSKRRRTAYFPFSGGKHLCPGRNLAFLEVAAIVIILLVGFDVDATGAKWGEVKAAPASFGSSIVKPRDNGKGHGIVLRPRQEWGDIHWRLFIG
jgi:cytochrome P450